MENAFVINHFGDSLKFFKYELYFLYLLRDNTLNSIVYLYSKNDTPIKFIKIINSLKLDILTIPYDDTNITYDIPFKSSYKVFNLLRTCNYIFAYKLIQFNKICIVESDMIITSNIDDIFNLNIPSIIYYPLEYKDINKNKLVNINKSLKKKILQECHKESYTNGGVILFKPSLKIFDEFINNLKIIIENNCIYPSETLFLYTINNFYNLPIMYNMSHFFVPKYEIKEEIRILHYNNYEWKPVDIIEDKNFNISTMKNPLKKKILTYFKNKYYNKNKKKINEILRKLK
jgi:hypothetical protein